MIEIAARECVFHYNKHNLVDPTVPCWVIKANGKAYYVEHVTSNIPWTTKETPNSTHTKGAIKFKKTLITIDDNNSATLSPLSLKDVVRLKAKDYTRILIMNKALVMNFIEAHNIRHSSLKQIKGRCGSTFFVCDILKSGDIMAMQLGISQGNINYNNFFRILQENEIYYKVYEDDRYLSEIDVDNDADNLIQDEYNEDDEDDEDDEAV